LVGAGLSSAYTFKDSDMSEGATASDSPFIKGRNARLYGKMRESCPYTEGSEDRPAWLQAYDEAGDNEAKHGLGTIDDVQKTL
jgi:ribosome modulation factor